MPDLISRKEAKSLGYKSYFTGKPCKHGHLAPRYTSNGLCSVCDRRYVSGYQSSPEGRATKRRAQKRYSASENGLLRRKATQAKRRAGKRTPLWADIEARDEFIRNCPSGFQCDHILPLQGRSVCGLHVLENLQYLNPEDNIRKSNKLLWEYAHGGLFCLTRNNP